MQLSYYISTETNPYYNIALEEFLLKDAAAEECILFLWQNERTVVLGRNQNLWSECNLDALQQAGGSAARRLSGGGAVFHDMGNLNFTFLVRKAHYRVSRQTEVILRAVRSFGIPAQRAGRNDLLIDGKKFSGNAYYKAGELCYHHGTILINVDTSAMSVYLSPSAQKLQAKAVPSVKSRVCNLTEYNAGITVEKMQEALLDAFATVYGDSPHPYDASRLNAEAIACGQAKFASWGWLAGRKIAFDAQWHRRFDWGEVSLQFAVSQGCIKDVAVWTDALDETLAARVQQALLGTRFVQAEMQAALGELGYLMEGEWNGAV